LSQLSSNVKTTASVIASSNSTLTSIFGAESWDRFYKTPFRPKSLRINLHPYILGEL
jgi:hypothetical protein